MNGVVIMQENILAIAMEVFVIVTLIEQSLNVKRENEQKTQDLNDLYHGTEMIDTIKNLQEFNEQHRGEKSDSFGCITWIIIICVFFGIAGILDSILPPPISYIPFAFALYGLYKMHKVFFGSGETNTILVILGAMMAFGLMVDILMKK